MEIKKRWILGILYILLAGAVLWIGPERRQKKMADTDDKVTANVSQDRKVETEKSTGESEKVGIGKPTGESEEVWKEKPTVKSEEARTEKPAGKSEEAKTEKPAEESGEVGNKKPAEGSEEVGKEKPAEESEEVGTEKPAEESEKIGTEKPAGESGEAKEEEASEKSEENGVSSDKEQFLISHTHVLKTEEKPASCLEKGYRLEYCTECGELTGRQEEIPALGHDFVKSVWESPTCQRGGYYNNTCQRCGLVECVTEDPLPHDVEDKTIQEGNCMQDTIIRHVCRQCGTQVASDTRYTVYDLHNWIVEVVDGGQVTCCADCGIMK